MSAPDFERRTLSRVKRYMLTYIIMGQVFVQLDRTNIGFAQLTMGKDLGISATAFGFASGIFALAAFFMQVPASVAFEKLGARKWLTGIMAVWGLVVMSQAFAQSGTQLTVLRFLLGALEAGYVPGAYILISQWFRGNNHGLAIAGLQIGTATSGVLGGPLAGWLLGHSIAGLASWRSLFLIEGGMTVIWSFVALLILADAPSKARWLDADEHRFLDRHLEEYQVQKAQSGAIEKTGFWDAMKDKRIAALMLSYACAGWVSATFAFFMPTLLKTAAKGLTNQTVGLMAIGPYFVMGLVALTWGRHADRTGERHWHCVLPLLVGAAGIVMYPFAKTPILAMISLAMVQAGNSGFFVNFWPTCNMIVGKQTIAKTTALINACTHGASFLAPIAFGWMLDRTGHTTLGLYICIGVLLTNFVIMHLFFLGHKAALRQARESNGNMVVEKVA